MKEQSQVHVAMAADDNYAHHLSVAICSILQNLAKTKFLHVHLLHEKLSDATKAKIEQLKEVRDFEIEYIKIDCSEFDSFKVMAGHYISRLTYARFQLPELLGNLNKCIYLDCDILVRDDLSALWDIPLPDNSFLAAVEEPFARHRNIPLGIPEEYSYFNAGVLVLDLAGLRTMHLASVACEYLSESGSLLYGDQDVLNALFYRTWHALPLRWNFHTHVYLLKDINEYYRYSGSEVEDAFENAALVHFSHERKPDSLISLNPYRKEYWHYLKQTAWKNMLPKDINPANVGLRVYWLIKATVKKLPILFYGMRMLKRILTGYYLSKSHSQ